MSSTLENEDLDNGPLVRMEDVQPARDRSCEVRHGHDIMKSEPLEAYIVDHLDYDNECVVDDDDSNIGSMVSIKSEDVMEDDNSSDLEYIVPENKPAETKLKKEVIHRSELKTPPDSWPTLEILPGGVIKNSDKADEDLTSIYPDAENETEGESGGMMYACAKCSQSFKYLFNLVRHVRGHEREKKLEKLNFLQLKEGGIAPLEIELLKLKRARLDLKIKHKRQKVELLTRIAGAAARIEDITDLF